MDIKTIEERLKIKADKIGTLRAKPMLLDYSKTRAVFKTYKNVEKQSNERRRISECDGWTIAEMYNAEVTRMCQEHALEELRKELVEMQERLVEITGED